MKPFSEYFGQSLEIATPNCFKSEYNLNANGITICNLKNVNFWGTRYEITGFENVWEIYTESVWKGTTAIKEKNKELPIATYEGNGLKHTGNFNLPQGLKVTLVFNLWKSFYELKNDKGEVLVHYKSKSFFSSTIVLTVNKKSELLDKYPFLVLMPFYIAMQRSRNAAAVTH